MEASEFGREMVVNALARVQAAGGDPPTFDQLQNFTSLGHADLVERVAALKEDGTVVEQNGGFSLSDEAFASIPAHVKAVTPVGEPDEPAPAEELAEFIEEEAEQPPEEPLPPAPIRVVASEAKLTRKMAQSLDDEALGKLVKAGLAESSRLVVVIE